MEGTVKFSGPIEQAAAGDVINKAPQYSNIVNLSLAAGGNAARSGDVLTIQQLNILRDLVKQLAIRTNRQYGAVWGDVLARASAAKAKEIPKEEYRDLEAFLQGKLAALSAPATKPPPDPLPAPLLNAAAPSEPAPPASDTAAVQPVKSQAPSMIPSALSAFSLGVALVAGYGAWDANTQLEQLAARLGDGRQNCQYEGKLYSPGSVLAHDSGLVQCAAADSDAKSIAHWASVDAAKLRRAAAQGRQ